MGENITNAHIRMLAQESMKTSDEDDGKRDVSIAMVRNDDVQENNWRAMLDQTWTDGWMVDQGTTTNKQW